MINFQIDYVFYFLKLTREFPYKKIWKWKYRNMEFANNNYFFQTYGERLRLRAVNVVRQHRIYLL